MKFRSDIEGLRAVAIVPVVLYHASNRLVPGGFVGVDVFFVISGFLISKIILDAVADGSFSYASFYRRRIRRIFPALFFMLALTSAAALVVLPPEPLHEYGETLLATALFVSNMEFHRLTNYFGTAAEFRPLLHTWSLAVEEQFYIVFPLFLMAAKRWFRGRLLAALLACAAASLAMSVWFVARHPTGAFYLGPPRAFELLIGAVLALDRLPKLSGGIALESVAGLGLVMIATSLFVFDNNTPFPGVNVLLPCLGAAAVIYAGQCGQNAAARLLSLSPVRFVGAISYSLYLWHWPVLALVRRYFLGAVTPFQIGVAVVVAIVLALVSWRFVERPFRSRRDKPVFGVAGAAMAGALALGGLFIASGGLPQRYSAQSLAYFHYADDFNPDRARCLGGFRRDVAYRESCRFGAPNAPVTVAVWGDSFGSELAFALGAVAGPDRAVMQVTQSGCPPALAFARPTTPRCSAHNQDILAHLVRDRRVTTVILVANYNVYFVRGLGAAFSAGFENAVASLIAAGKRVIVVGPIPTYGYPVPDAIGMVVARGGPPDGDRLADAKFRQDDAGAIAEVKAVTTKFHLASVWPERIFCGSGACVTVDGHAVLYFDAAHLSVAGARRLAAAIRPML